MIGVERVAVGMGDEHVGREGPDRVGDLVERVGADLQRVVAEVEAAEARAERVGGGLGLGVAQALDVSIVWPSCFHSSPDSPRSP